VNIETGEVLLNHRVKQSFKDIAWSKRPKELRFAVQSPLETVFCHPADATKRLF
jgi:hypothetical protein